MTTVILTRTHNVSSSSRSSVKTTTEFGFSVEWATQKRRRNRRRNDARKNNLSRKKNLNGEKSGVS